VVFGEPGLCVVFVRPLNKSRRERPMPASDAVLQTAQKLLYPGPETGNIQGDVDAFITSPTARPDAVKRLVTFLILHRHNEVERVGHFVAVSLYKQLEPFADVAGLAIGDPAGQRFSSTEKQYTTITTIGHEC